MDFLQNIVQKNVDFSENIFHDDLEKECDSYFKEIDNFLNNGSIQYFTSSISRKENVEQITSSTNKRKGRQKKPALTDITEINIPISPVHIKKEKISDVQVISKDLDTNIAIKKEAEEMPAPTKLPPRKKKVKTEQIEVPKRSTRSRTRTNNAEINGNTDKVGKGTKKSSDVILQNTTIITIEVSDGEKDTETESEAERNTEVRTTRSKMRKPVKQKDSEQTNAKTVTTDNEGNESDKSTRGKRKKRARSQSVEEPAVQIESKKSKSDSNSEKECNESIQTEYEDAVSSTEVYHDKEANQNVNATFIASSKDSRDTGNIATSLNSTIIVENPKMLKKGKDQVEVEQKPPETGEDHSVKASPEPVKKAKGTTKQIFSPYENTPLKKRVEAFEKLGVNTSIIPMRITRTKKKLQKKDSEIKDNNVEEKPVEKDKYKGVLTPLMSKFHPKGCSTSKISKLHPHYSNDTSTYNESILSAKSASALKASQAEFREREKRRQEKEKEALKKREALLQAQTEEKRRKREEKQQKAQQQREMLEKEKQKMLDAQRVKEEKYKQAMVEREEKLQKQKEEAEKKRLLAKKKAEMQREEEVKKCAEMKAAMDKQCEMAKLATLKQKADRYQQQSMPIYMLTRPPLLPTDDCYDSDDPEYEHVRKNEPYWSRDPEIGRQQRAMIICGESIKNSFFCRQAQTPDLIEIFEHIDPRKLKRTSSAIWRKPPRYTLMPTFEDQPVFSEESD